MTKRRTDIGPDTAEAWARVIETAAAPPSRTLGVGDHLLREKQHPKRVDGRSLRKTGRTEQFNVRVKAETKQEIQRLSDANDWLIGEVIEQAVSALSEKLKRST